MTEKRRAFGTIRKLESGRFQARYRDKAGRMRSAPNTFATKKQAEQFLSQAETDLLRGTWLDPSRAKVPFEELVLNWRGSRPNLRATTAATTTSYLRTLLLPYFKGMRAEDITVDQVRAWHAWATEQPKYPNRKPKKGKRSKQQKRSPNTVAKAYRLLRSIMEVAVDDEIIARNPCRLRGVASDRTPEQKVATPEEVEHITAAIKDPYKAMVQVAAYGGLRFGELIGLRRHRIDWKANTIRVVEQVTQPSSNVFVTGPPKTDAGVRTVTMPPEVMTALREHVNKHSERGRTGLVFPAPEGGHIRRSNFTRRVWHPARDKAGVPGLRFHDLRHTHATLAVAMGADTRTLMARMGHASARAALMYQHRQSDQPIADALSQVIATAKADAAKTTLAKAVGSAEGGSESPSDPASCGTNVARNGLRIVE